MAYLEVRSPRGSKRLKLDGSVLSIGRLPENDLVVRDEKASRRHCIIEPHEGGFRIRDLGSRNGVKLNDSRIRESMLDNGDVLRIGATELHYIDPEQTSSHKNRKGGPDFSAGREEDEAPDPFERQNTLDVDMDADEDILTDYEKRLREIIDSAPEKPFDENDISIVDATGTTVHEAESAGLERGKDESEISESLRIFRLLLLACFRARATDIHIEPRQESAAIRIRVDGSMVSAVDLGLTVSKRIFGMVKILCQIDTTRKAQVQDGHFSVFVKGNRVDYRVSFTPAMHGQKLVIRVLDSSHAPGRLHELGLSPWMYDRLRTVATRDSGLLLVTGPTGSGKTTTLYSCLREVDIEQRNVITIEDPVEYYLEGSTQIPVDHQQGNDFASILRSVLRQDPDVIFVGEVRDLETAKVAMQAAMTGHLVYTTVHAKDTIGSIFRLLDLGVENYLVANSLNLIVAQRLVRLLCEGCKRGVQPTPTQNMKMKTSVGGVSQIYVPVGCRRCLRTGFRGRRAIFELLDFNNEMRDVVLSAPSINKLRQIAQQGLFTTLQEYGYQLVAEGETAMEEIDRVAGSE